VGDASIRFAHPISKVVAAPAYKLLGAVLRAAIDDDMLDIGIGLILDALQRCFQGLPGIEACGNDGNKRRAPGKTNSWMRHINRELPEPAMGFGRGSSPPCAMPRVNNSP